MQNKKITISVPLIFFITTVFFTTIVFFYFLAKSDADLTKEQENTIDSFLNLKFQYNDYVSSLPKIQYKNFKKKLQNNEFISFRKVYSNSSVDGYNIFTDKKNQKYIALMVQNAENNMAFSKYYDNIIILPNITESMVQDRKQKCENIKIIENFLGQSIPTKVTNLRNGWGNIIDNRSSLPSYFHELTQPGVGSFCPTNK